MTQNISSTQSSSTKKNISEDLFILSLTGDEINQLLKAVGTATSLWAKNRRECPASVDTQKLIEACDKIAHSTDEKNKIPLTFADEEEVNFVSLVARRKGYHLPNYILDNIEWDDRLPCLDDMVGRCLSSCKCCDFKDTCPDVMK